MQQEEEQQQQHHEHLVEPPEEQQRPLPLAHSLSCGVSTFLAAGVVDLVAHLGPTGLVVGGIAAYVASQHGPELLEQVRGAWSSRPFSPPVEETRTRRMSGENGGSSKRSV